MGIIRFYLAMCVVLCHTRTYKDFWVHGGMEAVQLFFVISGFYMDMVFPGYRSRREFYISRFVRIYVPYWAMLFVVTVAAIVFGWTTHYWLGYQAFVAEPLEHNGLFVVILACIANVTIFFQDALWFICQDPGQWPTIAFLPQEPLRKLTLYAVIPPAWSVGVELTFYLLVPFLARWRSFSLVGIIVATIAMRVLTIEAFGMTDRPWQCSFFPFELGLFCLGMLSHRGYARLKPWMARRLTPLVPDRALTYTLYVLVILWVCYFAYLLQEGLDAWITPHVTSRIYAYLLSYMVWPCLLPVMFFIGKNNAIDRFVGDLSYPIYLGHWLALDLARIAWPTSHRAEDLAVLFSIVISLLMMWAVVRPLEKRRHRLAAAISNWFDRRSTVTARPAATQADSVGEASATPAGDASLATPLPIPSNADPAAFTDVSPKPPSPMLSPTPLGDVPVISPRTSADKQA
jgi:peptidoglycan/LPS O-acetylase OafA/YrhL